MGSIFRRFSAAFFGLLSSELRPVVSGFMPIHLDILWSYTSCLSTRQKQQQQYSVATLAQVVATRGPA